MEAKNRGDVTSRCLRPSTECHLVGKVRPGNPGVLALVEKSLKEKILPHLDLPKQLHDVVFL